MLYNIYENMVFYYKDEDCFIDSNMNRVPSVDDICKWYFHNLKIPNYNLKFNNDDTSQECKKDYELISSYVLNKETDISGVCNRHKLLLKIFKLYEFDKNSKTSRIKESYIPVVSSEYAAFIHLLSNTDMIIETIYRKRFRLTDDVKEYYRLKLGLEYLLLNMEKDEGCLMHISSFEGITRYFIDGIYNNQRCKAIINSYLASYEQINASKLSKQAILYHLYSTPKSQEKPLQIEYVI